MSVLQKRLSKDAASESKGHHSNLTNVRVRSIIQRTRNTESAKVSPSHLATITTALGTSKYMVHNICMGLGTFIRTSRNHRMTMPPP